jgi:hypothetical protein
VVNTGIDSVEAEGRMVLVGDGKEDLGVRKVDIRRRVLRVDAPTDAKDLSTEGMERARLKVGIVLDRANEWRETF